ncbi:proteasome activator BLM10 RNJ42_02308 [Nakaseomyces bracarensis]|uniref:proteasome activator BLM10 n=1 Tax=Nakaseomyces bracarensis TaxID=273131 RepID=UPI003872110F
MDLRDIHAPVPSRRRALAEMRIMGPARPASGGDVPKGKSPRMLAVATAGALRARSETPTGVSSHGADSSGEDVLMGPRLRAYGLDYVEDEALHRENLYDAESRWYSRKVRPKFVVADQLPYKIESHLDQARYLCHVIVNLYIAVSSLDIEGLISISSKDLSLFKNAVDDLAMKTDMFRLSAGGGSHTHPAHEEDQGYTTDQLDEDDVQGEYYGDSTYMDIDRPDSGKITASSATIININHWTNELKNCLQFDFPVSLRKSLAQVYYYISLCQGQKINRKMHVDMFEALVETDDQGTDFSVLLKDQGLVLDHEVLYSFLWEFLPYPDSDYGRYDLGTKEDLQLFRMLLRLSISARPFFDEKDDSILHNIMDKILSSLAPSTMSSILPILSSSVPLHYHNSVKITDYFSFCFSLWGSVSANVAVDTHMYDFVGMISEDAHVRLLKEDGSSRTEFIKFEKFGIFTEDQLNFMFNRLQGHLRTDGQIHSYSRTARPFIHSINGKYADDFFFKLNELTNAIETFVHPSNSGFWTKPIAKFTHSFVKMYHARWKEETGAEVTKEFCLTPYCHEKLLETIVDVINIGSQNKSIEVANYYISSLAYLLDLKPKNAYLIYNKIINDLNDALAGEYVNSRHRIISSLKQFTRTARYMVEDKLYRIHVTNILSNLIAKIDANDIELTGQVINALVTVFAFTPIKNLVKKNEYITFESTTLPFLSEHYFQLNNNKAPTFEDSEELLLNAFRASTTIFENIIRLYVSKIFELVDIDLEGSVVTKINQTTIIMQEAMDDEMFRDFYKIYQERFWAGDYVTEPNANYELVTIPLAAFIRRDSSLAKDLVPMLIHRAKEQVEKGAGSLRHSTEIQTRDVKLVLYLTALNDVLRQTHEVVESLSSVLMDFMDYIYETITNPPIDVLTSILLHSIIFTLTATEVTDTRMFPETSTIPSEERWGGLQFSDKKYDDENMQIRWHTPGESEITLAISFMEKYSSLAISTIENIIKSKSLQKGYGDEIEKALLILTHCLSGASLLFDPDFNKNKLDETQNLSYHDMLLLLKQVRESNCDSEELDIDLEQIRSDKGDDEYMHLKESDDEKTEGSDEIEIKDPDTELIIDDLSSEAPSGVSTPVPGSHNGFISSISPGVTFRELDIFQYNYHFGSSMSSKFKHPAYFKVHKIRSKIGIAFHKSLKFLLNNAENNTYMFQILLHSIKVWFTDVGQETVFNEDPTAFIDLDFLENIQYIAHLEEPYTRTCLAVRADTFHQNRVLLHSTNRRPSRLEVQLLRDVLDLAMSAYPDIHKPAQGTMVHCMKQIIGSYSIIIRKLLSEMEELINKGDYKKLIVLLKILMIKKINKKLMTDYKNMETLLIVLCKCLKIDEHDVGPAAEHIMGDIVNGLKIPSSVCEIDPRATIPISPPDSNINIQVEAVKFAKDKKRDEYFEILNHLQSSMVTVLKEDTNHSWKVACVIAKVITKLQSSIELPPSLECMEIVLEQLRHQHPKVTHLVVKSIISMCNRILSMSDYEYDIQNSYRVGFLPKHMTKIDTSVANYSRIFSEEMSKFDDQEYFIESKCFVGWLSWGAEMYVVKTGKVSIDLKESDSEILKHIGDLITKEILSDLCRDFVEDNATKNVFSSSNVTFFIVMQLLISNNYTKFTTSDLCELCSRYYVTDDKASMIMSAEIFGALISASKYMTKEDIKVRDDFLNKFLPECLDRDLNHDAFEVWSTITWWIPAVVDIRRCEPFYRHFSDLSNVFEQESASHQSYRIYMWRGILMALEYRMPKICDKFEALPFDHHYDQVRSAIGKLFSTIIQNTSHPGYESPHELLNQNIDTTDGLYLQLKKIPSFIDLKIKELFTEVLVEASRISKDTTPQQMLKTRYYYLSSTLMYWMTEMLRGPNKVLLVPYLVGQVVPFLASLMKNKEMCYLAGIDPAKVFMKLAFIPIGNRLLGTVVDIICNEKLLTSTNQVKLQLAFVQHFLSLQLLQLTEHEKDKILRFIVGHLYNTQSIEIRMKASEVLSGIIHNMGQSKQVDSLVQEFDRELGSHSSAEKKKLSKTDVHIHGCVLGLSAVVAAFPYAFPLPQWIPQQLSVLSSWARTPGMAGTAAKETISNFKKVRADTWLFDRQQFSYEQLEDLEGVLWKSYYA